MSIPLPDQPSWGRSQFPPIGDYGFLSGCETTALVAPDGGIEWLCLPRRDSPACSGDSRPRRRHGNFPQAFTHLALITAVTAVIRAERAQPR